VRPLHRIINNADAVQQFLQHGADPGAADDNGRTPLHVAADQRRTDVVQWLLDAGAAPSPADANGETPLHRLAVSSTPAPELGGLRRARTLRARVRDRRAARRARRGRQRARPRRSHAATRGRSIVPPEKPPSSYFWGRSHASR
jgi:hypothetical protein